MTICNRWTFSALLGMVAIGSGCSTLQPSPGFAEIERTTRDKLRAEARWVRTDAERDQVAARTAELIKRPLTVDDAVQIALLNNRGLQASYNELGISDARLVQAGRLPNPRFAMLRTSAVEDGTRTYTLEQVLTVNLFSLLTMPRAQEIERRQFEQVQRTVALEVLRIGSETRKAYYAAVAAEESLRYAREVSELAEAGAELARRMRDVGNFSRLQQAREQSLSADAQIGLARALQVQHAARERLTRLLGLWGDDLAFRLPRQMPTLPAAPADRPDIERAAMAERIDLQALRSQADALGANLGLARTTRFINVFEAGPARVLEGPRSDPYQYGYEIAFEIPLFDFGDAKVARAESIYWQAVDRMAEVAVNARSEVREAYFAYRTRYDIARQYRDEIVPLHKQIAEENVLRYNGMQIGVFDLLAEARAQIATVNASIQALRDFWIAEADLEMAMIGRPLLTPGSPDAALAVTAAPSH